MPMRPSSAAPGAAGSTRRRRRRRRSRSCPRRPRPGTGPRRAETAGADEQHLRVEQLELARLADLGDQHVARVARALRLVEHARRAPGEAVLLPAAEAAGQRRDVLVAELLERAGGERRARARLAGEHDRRRAVGHERRDARLEVAARDVHGALDRALVELVRLAHVDEDGGFVGRETGGGIGGADLERSATSPLREDPDSWARSCERYVHRSYSVAPTLRAQGARNRPEARSPGRDRGRSGRHTGRFRGIRAARPGTRPPRRACRSR